MNLWSRALHTFLPSPEIKPRLRSVAELRRLWCRLVRKLMLVAFAALCQALSWDVLDLVGIGAASPPPSAPAATASLPHVDPAPTPAAPCYWAPAPPVPGAASSGASPSAEAAALPNCPYPRAEPAESEKPGCPYCAQPMTLRTNPEDRGVFWGCRSFPRCKGTRRHALGRNPLQATPVHALQ